MRPIKNKILSLSGTNFTKQLLLLKGQMRTKHLFCRVKVLRTFLQLMLLFIQNLFVCVCLRPSAPTENGLCFRFSIL